jgi:hypothetical protein
MSQPLSHHRDHLAAWAPQLDYCAFKQQAAGDVYDPAYHARLFQYRPWATRDPAIVFLLESPTQALESAMAPLAESLVSQANCAVFVLGRHMCDEHLDHSVFAMAGAQMDHIDALLFLGQRFPNAMLCSYGNSGGGLRVATAHRYLRGANPELAERHCCMVSGVPCNTGVPWQLRALALAVPLLDSPPLVRRSGLALLRACTLILGFIVVFASYPTSRWLYWLAYWTSAQWSGALRTERLLAEVHHVFQDARMAAEEVGGDLRSEILGSERVLIAIDPADRLVDVSGWIGHVQVCEILGCGHNPQEAIAPMLLSWTRQWTLAARASA